jgi:hypothetical protein
MTFAEDSPQGAPQISPRESVEYVLVDRVSLAEVRTTIWELAEQLTTLERAVYNIEACELYWEEAGLTHEQILERVQYFYTRFWDEFPKKGLPMLHAQVVDLSRVLRVLTDFAIASEGGDK